MNTTTNRRPRRPTAPAAPTSPTGAPRTTPSGSRTGKKIAYRNLWISVPALLCGFAVWGMWGIITVQMLNLGFPFTQAELFTLTAIAGIAGATMRIPASFLIRLAGGRNTIFLTTAMLLAPAIGTGIVLQHKDWPLWAFQLMALWSGVGGGNFAQLDVEHQHLLPEAAAGHGARHQRRPRQLRRDDDADRHPAGDDDGPVRRVRRRADDAAEGQRLDLRQDRRRHADLDPERRLRLGAVAGAAVDPVLVRHEQPEDGVAGHRQPDRRLRQDHLPVHAGLHPVDPRAVPVPADAHRPGPASACGWRSRWTSSARCW